MILNGTTYSEYASEKMVHLLETLRKDQTRVRFHWGNTGTGEDWGDEFDVKGTIGRSSGQMKVPLLIHNARSMGGGAILTDCIVKITNTKGGATIYQHPKYHIKREVVSELS